MRHMAGVRVHQHPEQRHADPTARGTVPQEVGVRGGQPSIPAQIPGRAERLMTSAEVAEMLCLPVDTLYAWRYRGLGPPGYRVGRYVRYRRAAVEEWLETQADQRY